MRHRQQGCQYRVVQIGRDFDYRTINYYVTVHADALYDALDPPQYSMLGVGGQGAGSMSTPAPEADGRSVAHGAACTAADVRVTWCHARTTIVSHGVRKRCRSTLRLAQRRACRYLVLRRLGGVTTCHVRGSLHACWQQCT